MSYETRAIDGPSGDTAPDTCSIEQDLERRSQDLIEFYGRLPRILILGNIANYAYVTARILRRAGFDVWVADPDFYHIMASPEWLEVPFQGAWGDDFKPRWSSIDLGGYRRPDWFIQGPAREVFQLLAHAGHGGSGSRRERAARGRLERGRRLATGDFSVADRLTASAEHFSRRVWNKLGRMTGLGAQPEDPGSPSLDATTRDILNRLGHGHQFGLYRDAMKSFDVVFGFTLSATPAVAVGFDRVCAIELGTLRGLPFEDSDVGALTRWLYLSSPQVMVTNVDCLEAADRMGIDPHRRRPALHAYDVAEAVRFASGARPQSPPVPFFLAPARHHWKSGNLSWLKGNDRIIRAAGLLARRGYKFEVEFVDWGEEVGLSRQLIEDEGLSQRVRWIAPMPRLSLWPRSLQATAIVDQFQAAAFGGVGLDTMALGKRLISRYDATAGRAYFQSEPPMMACTTVDEIASAMARCLDDPDDSAGLGVAAQRWVSTEHGEARQLNDFLDVLEALGREFPAERARPSPEASRSR